MAARASFSLEDGIRTVSCIATLALRMRVSMSAIGSVIVIAGLALPSPTGLRHARHLAGVHHLSQADAAQPEVAEHGPGPAAAPAARVSPHLELRLAVRLLDQRLL